MLYHNVLVMASFLWLEVLSLPSGYIGRFYAQHIIM